MSHETGGNESHTTHGGDEHSGCEAPVVRDHSLLRCIGKGSYGDVWLARNSTGAFRAVKIVYRRAFQDTRPFEREFSGIKKFEPVSRSHEGFMDVLQVGINEDEEYFYYVMELGDDEVNGQQIDPATYTPKTLSKVRRKQDHLPVAECVTIALALSRALMELHKNKLVHRDIKPSNIIFVNGCPKLADIGLVAPIDEARSYVGTEGFIPPEGPGTSQADIYSLGKVLYEIATGKDRQDFPELPNLNDLPDRDAFLEFNEIIIRACNGNPQQRYQSADELHADLLLLENGKSVRRLHILERRWSAFKRTAMIGAVGLLIVAAVGYEIYSQWRRSEEVRHRQVGAEIAYGNAEMESGNYLGALPHFTSAMLLDNSNVARTRIHELRIGSLLEHAPKLTHLLQQQHPVNDVEFSPDGKWAAIAEQNGSAYLYNLETRQLSKPVGPASSYLAACFSPDSSLLVTANTDSSCSIWNVSSLTKLKQLPHPGNVHSVRFSSDGRELITSCTDGVARLWNLESGTVVRTWKHGNRLRFANVSHNGKFVVTASEDYIARLWDASSSSSLYTFEHGGWVYEAAFSPDDTKLVTASGKDHKARVWDVATGRQLFPELIHLDSVESAEFSPDGKLILTSSLDGTARLWHADTFAPVSANPILKHNDRVMRARFDSTGHRIIMAGNDGTVRVWDFADCFKTYEPTRTSYSADGTAMALIRDDRVQVHRGEEQFEIPHTNTESVFFSRQGHMLVWRESGSGKVELWNVSDQKLITKTNTSLSNCIPNEDGTRMLAYSGKNLRMWTFSTGITNPGPITHVSNILSAAFNGAGDAAMTVSRSYIQVWDAVTGQRPFPAIAFNQPVNHAEFSPDGKMIGGCCWDTELNKCYARVFDSTSGRPITPALNHGDGVLWITFSPDSKRVATASEDFSAVIWDARTGAQLCAPILHREKVRHAAFSADGKMLATIAYDSTIRIWNAETGDPLTPPLPCNSNDKQTIFTRDGLAIVADAGTSRLVRFPGTIPATDDLNDLSTLLSGSASKLAAAGATASDAQQSNARWDKLRTRYPALFTVGASNNPVSAAIPTRINVAKH